MFHFTNLLGNNWSNLWSPSTINTELWLDASDPLTITESTGVSKWLDKSTNDRYVLQSTGSAQPTYANNTVSFDGIDDYLQGLSFIYDNGGVDIFVIGSVVPSAADYIISEGKSTATTPIYSFTTNSSDGSKLGLFNRDDAAATNFSQATSLSATGAFDSTKTMYYWNDTATNVDGRVSGGSELGDAYTRATTTVDQLSIGCLLRTTASNFCAMDINEIIICNNLYAEERERIEGYLSWKWGLQADLPSTHPYKQEPPLNDFTPELLETQVWLDAADISTITESSNSISNWADKSGEKNNAIQATGSNQPTIQSSVLNELDVVRFDGGTECLNCGGLGTSNDSFAMFGVWNYNTITHLDAILATDGSWATASAHFLIKSTNKIQLSVAGGSTVDSVTDTALSTDTWYNFGMVNADTTTTHYLNGVSDGTTINMNATKNLEAFNIGAWDASRTFDGDIGELIIITGGVSDSEREKIEGYLAWKWGLVSNLPTTHPYRYEKPMQVDWTPKCIDTVAWYDANHSATINVSGTDITSIEDKSGNGNTLTPSTTGTNAPTYADNKISFTSGEKCLEASSALLTADYTIVAVAEISANTINAYCLGQGSGTTNGTVLLGVNYPSDGAVIGMCYPGFAIGSTSFASDNYSVPFMIGTDRDSSTIEGWANGTSIGTSSDATTAPLNSNTAIGGYGTGVGASDTFDLREMIIIDSSDIINRQKIEGYLTWKYGFYNKLPSTHPYKYYKPLI